MTERKTEPLIGNSPKYVYSVNFVGVNVTGAKMTTVPTSPRLKAPTPNRQAFSLSSIETEVVSIIIDRDT